LPGLRPRAKVDGISHPEPVATAPASYSTIARARAVDLGRAARARGSRPRGAGMEGSQEAALRRSDRAITSSKTMRCEIAAKSPIDRKAIVTDNIGV